MNRQRRRHLEQRVFTTIMRLSLFLALGVLGLILVTVVRKGLGALSWNMLTQSSTGGYYLGSDEGGILNAILGSLSLAAGATALALAAGVPMHAYLGRSRLADGWRSMCCGASQHLQRFAFTLMLLAGMRLAVGRILTWRWSCCDPGARDG